MYNALPMKRISLGLLFLLAILILCTKCKMKQRADFIGYNGKIYTIDSSFTIAEAFAVKDGKYIGIGTNSDIFENFYTCGKVILKDFKGAPIYPGFQDSHCHLFGLGSMLSYVNLRGLTSYESIIDSLVSYRANNPDVKFIIGDGWDQNLWEIKEFPDNKRLNELFPDIPVVLTRIDYHASIVNDVAINKAVIPDAKIGKIRGLFFGYICEEIKNAVLEYNNEDIAKYILLAQQECFKHGLTSVCTEEESKVIDVITSLINENKFILKADIWLSATKDGMEKYNVPFHHKNIKVETIKLYADGALGSRGATLIHPYSDDKLNSGKEVTSEQEFRDMCQWAYDNKFKVATHAIGDMANRRTLDIYGEFFNLNQSKLNWRIEHAQIIDKEDLNKFSEYGVIPSIQPTHCTSDMFWAVERLGDRIESAYIYQSLLKQYGWLPSGTDFPIEGVNPIYTFYAAVYRKNIDMQPEAGFQMQEALSKEDAIRSMTIWGAKATQEEDIKGSIELGKYADFVVLDTDLMIANEKEILGAKVNSTYLNGILVWEKL